MKPTMEEEGRDYVRDVPCFILACIIHIVVLSHASGFAWSAPTPTLTNVLPVEFVRSVPKSPFLAPMAPGDGRRQAKPGHGLGPVKAKKVKRGSPLAPKKPAVKVAPKAAGAKMLRHAAPKSDYSMLQPLSSGHISAHGSSMKVPVHHAALSADLTGSHLEARMNSAHLKAPVSAKMAVRSAAMKINDQQMKVDDADGSSVMNENAEAVRRRAAQAMAQADATRRQTAESAAAESMARNRVDVDQQLATLSNPDEAISNGGGSGGAMPAGRGGRIAVEDGDGGGGAGGGDGGGPASGGGIVGDGGESKTVFDADGRGGRDALNSPASGGGMGEGGGPVSWAIMGPAGGRRLLRRVIPPCPDWVTERSLDISVQLKFRVLDDGTVKEGILIQKTSGFPDLDRQAIAALRKWKFETYRHGANVKSPEVWGVVKFHFVAA